MSADILVLRPQPGADATATRALTMGLQAVVAPLFTIRPLHWTMPDGPFDAVILTSANAVRHAGGGLTPFLDLPCYAVGAATAHAAGTAGFTHIHVGPADGAALVAQMTRDGIRIALHPCGVDHIALTDPGIRITDIPVYVADPVTTLPPAANTALVDGAFALLHSPRAAALFAALIGTQNAHIRIIAISNAAARAAGTGWASVAVAPRPRDEALLELAAKLCQTGAA